MNIIIPIGGIGERFKNSGYYKPKPLIDINGMPMIQYVINNLNKEQNDNIIVIYNKELDNFNFHNYLPSDTIKYKLTSNTNGAIETIYNFLNIYDISKLYKKTLICDCDTFYNINILELCRPLDCNGVFCFEDKKMSPIYSYIKTNDDGDIIDIKEKQTISNLANTGAYFFSDINILKQYCSKTLQLNYRYNNEFYTSCTIDMMIKDKHPFKAIKINFTDFHCVGTPHQLKMFAIQNKNFKPKRFCFDIDNTLFISKKFYSDVEIIEKNVNYLKFLHNIGHTIILYTARRMKTHNGCVGKIIADVGKITIDTLQKFNIPYDELYFGKPYADYYIDDLGINAYYDLEKETGFYENTIKERNFNNIATTQLDVIIKKGKHEKIQGEIFFYKNIPNDLKHLFPSFIKDNDNSYCIEKINGMNLSYIYIKQNLTNDMFLKILFSIKKLHEVKSNDKTLIYLHYIDRLEKRFTDSIYSKFTNSSEIFNMLNDFFTFYSKSDKAICGICHGDPVFSNILINTDNEIKFIDMRGVLLDKYVLYGDIMYDYAKIYQSLLGYDELLHDVFLPNKYKHDLINIFSNYIIDTYGSNYLTYIKIISYSHIFTMLPLHNINKSIKFYELINKNDIIQSLATMQ